MSQADIEKERLRLEAQNLENDAKLAKARRDYRTAMELHVAAAKIRKALREEKSWKWNLANYHSIFGEFLLRSRNFKDAREHFKLAETLFLEIGLRKPAFFNAYKYLATFIKEEKELKVDNLDSYIEEAEVFLDRYSDFSQFHEYLEVKLNFYKRKSIKYRLEEKYELAEIWARRCYEIAQEGYKRFKRNSLRKAAIFNEHMYWNLRAKRLKAEKKFKEAAECYKRSASVIDQLNHDVAVDEMINYYKCLAIANKYDKDLLESNLDLAIELADSIGNEKEKHYILGLKYDHLANFTRDLDEKIELLKKAKKHYYAAGEPELGKEIEFFVFYYLSKKELRDGNYKKSIEFLNKAISSSKYVNFPNVVPSPQILEYERHLYEAYLFISKGEFSKAANALGKWLKLRQDISTTRRYKFYEHLQHCCLMLGKTEFTLDDLIATEEHIVSTRENKLGLDLYRVLSLVYGFISLQLHDIGNEELLKSIELEITRRITTEEVARDLENRLTIHRAVEERDWLLRLPQEFLERFDHLLYLIENILDEFKITAYKEFYVLLENFIRIVVEFNSKSLWGKSWEKELQTRIHTTKPFDRFTLGDFVNSLRALRDSDAEFLKDVPSDTFDLLSQHVEIRNRLTHDLVVEDPSVDIVNDLSKIMFSLLGSFPIVVQIMDTRQKPWYSAEIRWGQLPKRVSIYYDKCTLTGGHYYIEPSIEILGSKLYPNVVIAANNPIFTNGKG